MKTSHKKLLEAPVDIDWQVTEAALAAQDPEAIEVEVDRRMKMLETQRALGRDVVRGNVEIMLNERVRVLKGILNSAVYLERRRWLPPL